MFKKSGTKTNTYKQQFKDFKKQKKLELKKERFTNKVNQKKYFKEAVDAAVKGEKYDTTKLRGNKFKQFANRLARPFRKKEGKAIADVEYNLASSSQGKRSSAGEALKIQRQRNERKFNESFKTRRELGAKAIQGGAFVAAMGALGKGMKEEDTEDESSR